MPVAGMASGKGPPDIFSGQPCQDVFIFGYIRLVVVVNKLVSENLLKSDKYSQSQNQINYKTLKLFNPWLRETRLTNSKGKKYYIQIPYESFRTDSYTPKIDPINLY